MITDKIKKLAEARAELEKFEQLIARKLAGLPAQYGFNSVNAFIAAVRAAVGKRRGRKSSQTKSAAANTSIKRRKRAIITVATRAEVKKLVGDGKTGNEISKTVGISLPSVQNIKKAFGLVRKKKK
ncbi:MAG: helix-turn-helix domain-containing protein [Opitutus sp.]